MKDLDDNNPNDADDKPGKKKATAAGKYKAMVAKPDTSATKPKYDPTKQPTYDASLLTKGRFMVDKKGDGVMSPWGNPIEDEKAAPPTPAPAKASSPPSKISDKAAGLSNTFYPARGQRNGADVKTIRKNGY